jgi:tetratricopeptide (TPR) repeat protein
MSLPGGVERLQFGFVGRRSARAHALRRWREGTRCLVVTGLGGLGKTALCTELAPMFAAELRSRTRPARIVTFQAGEAREAPSPILVLWRQFEVLAQGDDWQQQLARWQKDGLSGLALARAVVQLGKYECALLVYVDDLESVQLGPRSGEPSGWRDPEVAAFWAELRSATSKDDTLGLLASSRYFPTSTDPRSELPLGAMREVDLLRMLSWYPGLRELPSHDTLWLADQIDGHPRTVEYLAALVERRLARSAPPGQHATVRNWRKEVLEPLLPEAKGRVTASLLLGEILASLGPHERAHLGACCLLRAPAPWELVLHLQSAASADSARTLVHYGLLSPFESGAVESAGWRPHALVVEAHGSLQVEVKRSLHEEIGAWYAVRLQEVYKVAFAQHAIEHLLLAARPNGAWKVVHSLALRLRQAGRYRAALGLVVGVLEAGPTGPSRGLALVFKVQLRRAALGLLQGARDDIREALSLLSDEEDLLFARGELAETLFCEGDLKGACEHQQAVVEATTLLRGAEHPETLGGLHNLAPMLSAQGDLTRARALQEFVLSVRIRILGAEHPDTLAARQNLGVTVFAQGDLAGARVHEEVVLEALYRVLPQDHPQTLAARLNLAQTLFSQGDLAGARMHEDAVLVARTRLLGAQHPDTLTARHNLGSTLFSQGDLAGARTHQEAVLVARIRILGGEHPETLATRQNLLQTLLSQEDLIGSQMHQEALLEALSSPRRSRRASTWLGRCSRCRTSQARECTKRRWSKRAFVSSARRTRIQSLPATTLRRLCSR